MQTTRKMAANSTLSEVVAQANTLEALTDLGVDYTATVAGDGVLITVQRGGTGGLEAARQRLAVADKVSEYIQQHAGISPG